MYGHVHDIQSYSLKQFGRGHTIEAVSIGCLCDLEQGYVGKAPTNWSLAFAVVYFRPNGDYNAYVVRIINGAFTAPNGKTYKI